MPESKEIKIRAVLDSSTFDKGVNEITEKLRKITQQQAQGAGTQKALGKDTVMGKYAQQAFGDFSKESQRQLEAMYRTQRQEAVSQQVTMKGKQQELDKMLKSDAEMTKQQQQRVDLLKKEIDLLKEKHRQTLTTASETQKALDKMGGGGQPPGGVPTTGGVGGQPPAGPGMFKQLLRGVGAAAIIHGVVNAAVTGVEDVITRERKIAVTQAAVATMASREMREGMAGQGSRGMFWMPERRKAMEAAAKEQGREATLETIKGWGGTALQGVGALATMTGVGVPIGLGLFGAGTAMKGGLIGSETTRAAMFDREKFNTLMAKGGMEKYEQELAARKAMDPRKQMAREYFEQNREQMAGMQTLAGLRTDRELMGEGGVGMLQREMGYGKQYGGVKFSQQTIQEQMAALAAGGATTQGIGDLGGAAATYNRQFNLRNSGQVMGRMQGNIGQTSAMTDMAYQKLLSEAVRLGVDASTMPRELERMTQITAELATAGGVEAEGMRQIFGAGLGGFNQRAVEAAAGAAELYKETGKAAGGWEGQMGYGFLQSEEAKKLLGGKSLTAEQMNAINQTSAAELDEEGFQRLANYLDTPVDNVKTLLQKKDKFKQGRTGAEDQSYQDLQAYFQERGANTVEKRQEALKTKQGGILYEAARVKRGSTREGFLQKTQAVQEAEILTQAGVEAGVAPTTEEFDLRKKAEKRVEELKKAPETRAARVEEGAIATGDLTRIQALNENLEGFKNAAKGYTTHAVEYNTQLSLMIDATKKGASAMTEVANHLLSLEKKMADEAAGNSSIPSAKPQSGYGE